MAWNGFLAQRDIERAFNLTQNVWQRITQRGRLWTPDPAHNRVADQSKQEAARQLVRLRTGGAPADGALASVPALVEAFDLCEPARSRSLLDHLRRLAEKGEGRLPPAFPPFYIENRTNSVLALAQSNRAYLTALAGHLRRQPHAFSLTEHYPAVRLCAEALIRARRELDNASVALADFSASLQAAAQLARQFGDSVNEACWEGEAAYVIRDLKPEVDDPDALISITQYPISPGPTTPSPSPAPGPTTGTGGRWWICPWAMAASPFCGMGRRCTRPAHPVPAGRRRRPHHWTWPSPGRCSVTIVCRCWAREKMISTCAFGGTADGSLGRVFIRRRGRIESRDRIESFGVGSGWIYNKPNRESSRLGLQERGMNGSGTGETNNDEGR